MAQNRHNKPLTLGVAHAARLCREMPCWMAPRHRAAAVRVCTVSHLHVVPTTGSTDLYERSRSHPPFTALVWRFPRQCVLGGLSIEPGLAAVAASNARHPHRDPLPCVTLVFKNGLLGLANFPSRKMAPFCAIRIFSYPPFRLV